MRYNESRKEGEFVDLLGEPIHISDAPDIKYEYYVGEGIIDPYYYQIEFDNNIAVNTALFEH